MKSTITLLNKLKASDSVTKQDIWYKTLIDNAVWKKIGISDVSGTTVGVGEIIKVLLDFSESYLPYHIWKDSADRDITYTISQNDYIILGNVTEEITNSNIQSILKNYGDYVCTVRSITELDQRVTGQEVQLMIEGV